MITSKFSIVLIITLSFGFGCYGQSTYTPPTFTGIQPTWIHLVYDETSTNLPDTDGFSHFSELSGSTRYKLILQDDGLIQLTYSLLDGTGWLVEKLNLDSGEPIWQSTHDYRNLNTQEQVEHFFINKNNDLELLGARSVKPASEAPFFLFGGSESKPSRKILNTETGEVIYSYDPDLEQTNTPTIKNALASELILSRSGESIHYFGQGYELIDSSYYVPTVINIEYDTIGNLVDSSEYVFDKFKTPLDENWRFQNFYNSTVQFSQDSFAILHTASTISQHPDSIDQQCVIEITDASLNIIRTLDFSADIRHPYEGGLSADPKYFYISSSVPDPEAIGELYSIYQIYDHSGHLIYERDSRVELPDARVFRNHFMQEDDLALVSVKIKESKGVEFYKVDDSGALIYLSTIEWDSLSDIFPISFVQLPDGDIIGKLAHRKLDATGAIIERYMTLMRFSAVDIGLREMSRTSESLSEQFKVYPNPTLDRINITSLENHISEVSLLDMYGNTLRFKTGMNATETSLSIRDFPAGVYNVMVRDKASGLYINRKVVKL